MEAHFGIPSLGARISELPNLKLGSSRTMCHKNHGKVFNRIKHLSVVAPGVSKGECSSPLAHDFAEQSLVCYACPPSDVKLRAAALMGGAELSGRKTGRDFERGRWLCYKQMSADGEKITACFH